MRETPYIAASACRHGITPFDIQSVLNAPIEIVRLTDLERNDKDDLSARESEGVERPNVDVYAGLGVYQQKLVVFVDRFENQAFHAEPGDRNFGWMF